MVCRRSCIGAFEAYDWCTGVWVFGPAFKEQHEKKQQELYGLNFIDLIEFLMNLPEKTRDKK
jgi:hypothetical protein